MSHSQVVSFRLFVAVPVSRPISTTLTEWVHLHKAKLPFRKWTHPADYHITLQFLGDTTAPVLSKLIESLQQVSYEPFTLSLDKIGTFGPKASPRILWASVLDQDSALKQLQQYITERTAPLGFAPEMREFRAHLTLARDYRGDRDFQLPEITKLPQHGSWQVDHFTVMKSNLKSSPMYEVVHSFPF